MTNWIAVERKPMGRGQFYGEQWGEVPAIAINKSGLTLNQKFVEAFITPRKASQVLVFISKEERKLGLKPISDYDHEAFALSKTGSSSYSKSRLCHCKEAGKLFPETIGRAYRAHLDIRGAVIEIELSPQNLLK